MGRKMTVPEVCSMKEKGEKIVCLTAYDYCLARILDESGIDILLVGDSLGSVVQGHDSTLPVTVDDVIYHTKAVVRGRRRALVVSDMPFMTFQLGVDEAKRNAGRLVQEGGAESVKLEGGVTQAATIEGLVKMGVPVMGHVGLTPQSVHQFGGYRIQGRGEADARAILDDAMAVEQAGAFAVVLEGMPVQLAREITQRVSIPTIGIGAGMHCDGQILVVHDMLGLFDDFTPKFVKRYANLKETIGGAVRSYMEEVRTEAFPAEEHTFH
ncbi:3-methyl-2-oxobutanoate hydroxymethyltransferase [Geodia barretti]|uniref:3-methyl-2-oxobutanoate hydroxymethyltransferase n=4 Tax=Geodia barretti TaxID=519541 RepID=A0AA35QRU0_GEOBA|nr:3-methyl-2-oxobutanoate hydroxymethyltransferase [Geodia barretti]